MYERIDVAVKGSLLHDIGKIVFRSNHSGGNHSKAGAEFISDESTSMTYTVYKPENIALGIDRRLIYEKTDKQSFDKSNIYSI